MTKESTQTDGKAKVARSPLTKNHIHSQCLKNIAVGGGLMVLGEISAQIIKCIWSRRSLNTENHTLKKSTQGIDSKDFSTCTLDWFRIVRQGGIGSFQGFYQHIYYTWLDRKLLGNSIMVVAKKVLLDELFLGPISLVIFFIYSGTCETGTLTGGFERTKQLFWSGYLSDLAFWPVLQTVNFAFVPTHYRVLYVSFFTSVWDTYLCLLNFKSTQNIVTHDYNYDNNANNDDDTSDSMKFE